MARKKVDETAEKPALDISKEIISTYGENVIMDAAAVLDADCRIISVSPTIDMGLSGGVPEGSWVTFTGLPKKGKTTLALHLAAQCQKPENDSRPLFYFDVEGRMKKMNLQGIKGLDIKNMKVIRSTEGNILNAEQILAIAEKVASTIPRSVLIIDSYSALCTEAEITKGMDEQQRTDGQKLLAKFCRRMANIVPVNKNIIIGITHQMGNPSGYGGDREKGGYAIAYQADIKLKAGAVEAILSKAGKQIGQKVEWQVQVSALGPPGAKVYSTIRYGIGIDRNADLFDVSVELGLLDRAGAWYSFNADMFEERSDYLHKKFNGQNDFIESVAGDADLYNFVYNQVKKLLFG